MSDFGTIYMHVPWRWLNMWVEFSLTVSRSPAYFFTAHILWNQLWIQCIDELNRCWTDLNHMLQTEMLLLGNCKKNVQRNLTTICVTCALLPWLVSQPRRVIREEEEAVTRWAKATVFNSTGKAEHFWTSSQTVLIVNQELCLLHHVWTPCTADDARLSFLTYFYSSFQWIGC